jgi:hypothetical protein
LAGSTFGGDAAARRPASLMAMYSAYSSLLVPLTVGTLMFSPAAKLALTDLVSTLPSTEGTMTGKAVLIALAR